MDIKETVKNTQVEKVREYWSKPERNFDEFKMMLDLLSHQVEGYALTIPANTYEKGGEMLVASYTQMAQALGIQIDEFHKALDSDSSHASIVDINSSEDFVHDRNYGTAFWLKRKDSDADFKGMMNSLEADLKNGEIRTLIADEDGKLTDVSRQYLSGKRLFYRSIGFDVGEYDLNLKSGVAVAKLTK